MPITGQQVEARSANGHDIQSYEDSITYDPDIEPRVSLSRRRTGTPGAPAEARNCISLIKDPGAAAVASSLRSSPDSPDLKYEESVSHRHTSRSVWSEESEESFDDAPREDCGHQFVVHDSNFGRKIWNAILLCLLLYTGTVTPARLCFVDFRIPESGENDPHWSNLEYLIDGLFWLDLVVNFFFSYHDEFGKEVDVMWEIFKKYMKGYFMLNLIACLPEQAVQPLFNWALTDHEDSSVNKLTRMARLQRTTRLARLARLVRLARLAKMVSLLGNNQLCKMLQGMRGMRVVNFVVFLFWIVHILACGWYLCAALHSDFNETWVARRQVASPYDSADTSLMSRGALEQWLHSMYFVFTIFTTVGFGDISAFTTGEISYAIFTMLIGAIVHSIIVSEMINIVTSIDSNQIELTRYREIVDGFVQHTHIDQNMRDRLKSWLEFQASTGAFSTRFDKDAMREIVTNGLLPAALLRDLPSSIYGGRLEKNKFLQCCLSHTAELPPRASILVSLCLIQRGFVSGEVVYQLHDHPFNVFLVDGPGVFAYVAKATPYGGVDEVPISIRPTNAVANNALAALRSMSEHKSNALNPDKKRNSVKEDKLESENLAWQASTRHHRSGSKEALDAESGAPIHGNSGTTSGTPIHGNSGASSLSKATTNTALSRKTYKSGKTAAAEPKEPKMHTEALFPYELFTSRSYFGDLELLQSGSRRCTARCEEKGWLLVLHKRDLTRIMEDFPHFGNAWRAAARAREMKRIDCLATLTHGADYKTFAVTMIQLYFRRYVSRVPPEKRKQKAKLRRRASFEFKQEAKAKLGQSRTKDLANDRQGAHGARNPVRQAEEDVVGLGGYSASRASATSTNVQELRHELRSSLAAFKHDMVGALRDHFPAPEVQKSSSRLLLRAMSGTFVARPDKPATTLPVLLPDAVHPSAIVEVSSTHRLALLEAENQSLRAQVAEQQRQLDAVKELVMGSVGGNVRDQPSYSASPNRTEPIQSRQGNDEQLRKSAQPLSNSDFEEAV